MKNVEFNADPNKLRDPKMEMSIAFPAYMKTWAEKNAFKVAYIKNHMIRKND